LEYLDIRGPELSFKDIEWLQDSLASIESPIITRIRVIGTINSILEPVPLEYDPRWSDFDRILSTRTFDNLRLFKFVYYSTRTGAMGAKMHKLLPSLYKKHILRCEAKYAPFNQMSLMDLTSG